ncbi:unnamed protein product [Caretta caretta]
MGSALQEPELRLVLSAYADDVLLVVRDPGDLAQVEACQAVYSAASSARVNWVKSSGLVNPEEWEQFLMGDLLSAKLIDVFNKYIQVILGKLFES